MPFKSKSQMRWMFANEPEMAKRWADHTPDTEDLPEKISEAFTPLDDPDLDPDEAEELAAQFGDYNLDDYDDEGEEVSPPPPSKPAPSKPKFSMASMMKKAITSAPVSAPEAEVENDQPTQPLTRSITTPQKRRRGSYSTSRKLATLGRRKDVFNPEYITLRPDIERFEDRIRDLRSTGLTSSRIAQAINDEFGLGEDSLKPTDVANYLKSIGEITRGAASSPQDLGSLVPHNHKDPGEWHDDCPACTYSTSFESEWNYPQHVIDALKDLGEFSTEEAIMAARELPEFQDERTGSYSDVNLPGGYQNLGDLVKQVLRGSGLFEPLDQKWSKKMFTPAAHKIRWRYVGGGLEESKNMSERYCPSCEEGNHHRCRDESCACCGGNAIKEMFDSTDVSEAANRPMGSSPFQDWSKMGNIGSELKRQADSMRGSTYRTQDGKLLFYKDQMGAGEQPLVADTTQGIWTQNQPQSNQQQTQGTMQSVFSPKTAG